VYPETGKIKLPPEYLREIANSDFNIHKKLFLHRINFIIKYTRIQALDIEIPHPLRPTFPERRGGEKQRGLVNTILLTGYVHEVIFQIFLHHLSFPIQPNANNTISKNIIKKFMHKFAPGG